MEWLRSVDLAEYAPNLRGSGVHGGLVVSTQHPTVYGSKKQTNKKNLYSTNHLTFCSTFRCWSLGLIQTRWPCCWTSLPRKRCWDDTWPPTSTAWWEGRLSRRRGSTPRWRGTPRSASQLKSRWDDTGVGEYKRKRSEEASARERTQSESPIAPVYVTESVLIWGETSACQLSLISEPFSLFKPARSRVKPSTVLRLSHQPQPQP